MVGNTPLPTKGCNQGLLTNQIGLKLHRLAIGTGTDLLGDLLLQTMQFFNGDGANRLNLAQATALANREEAAAD